MAPFELVICPVGYDKSEMVRQAADELHHQLENAGIDVVLDDRGERPGAMFADWELIGVPYRLVIGERSLKEGNVEFQGRGESTAQLVPVNEITEKAISIIRAAKDNLL
jgi:prolyl-tRNA synthetase